MHPNDGRVVSNFIMQALLNEPITIYGSGSQTRSFCYVDDLIEGVVRFMNSEKEFIGPMNLGNTIEWTVIDLAKRIIELTNSRSEIVLHELPIDDPKQRKPNIDLAIEKLDWKPMTNLDDGLKLTINHFENLISSSKSSQDYSAYIKRLD
jgi:UDP-glucuronate decarboxylase